jgi:hypothetical protein
LSSPFGYWYTIIRTSKEREGTSALWADRGGDQDCGRRKLIESISSVMVSKWLIE